jgi:pimeloyl-ACP methyl ester carboxylesterase
MAEVLGWEVTSPVMSAKGWNIGQETQVLLDLIDANEYDIVAGSSMGGLAAANASALRPDADFSLLLIAPAFGLADLWRTGMPAAQMDAWKTTGSIAYHHHGFGHHIELPWDFMEAADKLSWPTLNHPTVILHGTDDDVVPIENSRKVPGVVALLEIEDGHRMQLAMPHFAAAAALLSR